MARNQPATDANSFFLLPHDAVGMSLVSFAQPSKWPLTTLFLVVISNGRENLHGDLNDTH